MYRRAFNRQAVPRRTRAVEPKGRAGISKNRRAGIPPSDGRAQFFESMIVLSTVAVLAVAIGLALGVPLALMLGDFCSRVMC